MWLDLSSRMLIWYVKQFKWTRYQWVKQCLFQLHSIFRYRFAIWPRMKSLYSKMKIEMVYVSPGTYGLRVESNLHVWWYLLPACTSLWRKGPIYRRYSMNQYYVLEIHVELFWILCVRLTIGQSYGSAIFAFNETLWVYFFNEIPSYMFM